MLTFEDGNNFDIYIMDLCEAVKPETGADLQRLAEELHERLEMAIEDFINDSPGLSIDDYLNQW